MTDEEKKAIEILKNFTIKEGCKKCSVLDRETCVVNGSDCIDEAIEIALNLIQKQQAELEKKDNKIKQYENMILEHKKQLHKSGIYGYDYDLELLESEK